MCAGLLVAKRHCVTDPAPASAGPIKRELVENRVAIMFKANPETWYRLF